MSNYKSALRFTVLIAGVTLLQGLGMAADSGTPCCPTSFQTGGDSTSVMVGYARVQPGLAGASISGLEILGVRRNGVLVSETGVAPPAPISAGRIYAEVNGPVNTGVATVNPHGQSATAGDIVTPRAHPSATLLTNGKVLMAGGYGTFGYGPFGPQVSGALSSAELYDPVAGIWSSTGYLSEARVEFTATLLANGKVLVAGGGVSGGITSAELYDPNTGTWSPTGPLITGRSYHTATLLPSGKVLVTGGFDPTGQPLSSAELYDPDTGIWSRTGDLHGPTLVHTATLLLNGNVLTAGGQDGNIGGYLNTAELYNPETGAWSRTGDLNKSYYWHTATRLSNGKVLLVGSLWFETNTTTEIYDPSNGTWSITAPLNSGRVYHTATLLPNGKVLVLGGYDNPTSTFLNTGELYEPTTEVWMPVPGLNAPRAWHTATLLASGKVLIAAGGNASGFLSSTELYDSGTNAATLSLQADANQATFSIGQTLSVGGSVTNPGLTGFADFYVGILRPDGSIQFFTSTGIVVGSLNDLASFRPIATAIPLGTAFSVSQPGFYTHQWASGDIRGAYTFFIAALTAGALSGGTVTNDQIVGLATAPFSFP